MKAILIDRFIRFNQFHSITLGIILALHSHISWAGSRNHPIKIAVLGAGVSGLTAARTLKKLGYDDVTVFEKEEEVGGKVKSVRIDDHDFELGAVWVTRDYSLLRKIANEAGISFKNDHIPRTIIDEKGRHFSFEEYFFENNRAFDILSSLFHFGSLEWKYAKEWHPGFAEASPDLYEDFDTFSKKHGISPIAKAFEPFFVACGYGYYKEVPAIYLMKLMKMMIHVVEYDWVGRIPVLHFSGLQRVEGGFQQILMNLAATLNVRTKSNISNIRRIEEEDHPRVELTINGGTEKFDRVISSIPLNSLNEIFDVSNEEGQLFGRVQSYHYWVTIFRGENLPKGESFFFEKNTQSENMGQPIVLANPYPDTDLWVAYQLAQPNATTEELEAHLNHEIEKMGGRLKQIEHQKAWQYFHHVTTSDLRNGFYQRMESLQGKGGFYYIGGIMGFESTEHTAEYAEHLVKDFFPKLSKS